MPGSMLGDISITPLPIVSSKEKKTGRLRDWWVGNFIPKIDSQEDCTASCWHGPNDDICKEIEERTEQRAAEFLRHLRTQLGVATPSAQSLPDFLQRAMSGDAGAVEVLVHTQYFDNPKLIKALAACIRNDDADVSQLPPEVGATSASGRVAISPEHAEGSASDFVWWIVRGLVIVLILLLPAAALWQLGHLALYPSSRQHNLAWASSTEAAIAAAAPRMRDLGRFSEPRRSPTFVRWLSLLKAVGRDEAANEFVSAITHLARDPFKIAVMEAVVAEKLLELDDIERAREVVRRALERVSVQPTNSEDELRKARVEQAQCVILGGCDQLTESNAPPKRSRISTEVEVLWGFVDEAAMDQPRVPEATPLTDRVQVAVQKLSGVKEPRELLSSLNVVLILHQKLLDAGHASDADIVINEAKRICQFLEGLRQTFADDEMAIKVVDNLVITAKSQRLNRHAAVAILNWAEQCARSGLQPDGEIQALARVGAGFARLGYFHRARELSASADPAMRLLVAKEMLANELERQRLGPSPTEADARAYGELRRATDEQVDPLRGEYDGFR